MRAGLSRRALILAPAVAAGCTPLEALNTFAKVDKGGGLAATGVAYGADPRQALDVYRPERAGAAPVLVYFYGGNWNSGSRQDYAFIGKTFAARGFVTVVADYRIMPRHPFPAFVDDGAAAIRYARAHAAEWGGVPGRVFVAGHSAGAYIAAMLAVSPRYGVQQDLAAVVGIAGPYDFYPFTNQVTAATFGKWPNVEETQPARIASGGGPPILLLQGADDTTVLPRNAEALARRLAAVGTSAAVKLYPGVGHIDIMTALTATFRKQAPTLADTIAFFIAHGARPV